MPLQSTEQKTEIKNLSLADLKKKIMDLVARRDHSVSELQKKLENRSQAADLEQALAWAQQQSWFLKSQALTEKVAQQLSRSGKGLAQINQKLESLGLSTITRTDEEELEKARLFFKSKWASFLIKNNFETLNFEEKQKVTAKVVRSFASKGFESHIINEILKTDLKMGHWEHEEY